MRLGPVLQDILVSSQNFEWISFIHIHRELNEKVDELSKESMSLLVGALGFYEFIDGEDLDSMEFCF
jgi:hypothetical protein